MTAGALRAKATHRLVPHTRVGRSITFTAEDIFEILAAARIPARQVQPRLAAPRRRRPAAIPEPAPGVELRARPERARRAVAQAELRARPEASRKRGPQAP